MTENKMRCLRRPMHSGYTINRQKSSGASGLCEVLESKFELARWAQKSDGGRIEPTVDVVFGSLKAAE